MDALPTSLGSRLLLQAPDSSTNLPKNIQCSGAVCLIFNILVIVIILFIATVIFSIVLFKKWRYARAISRGSIPSKFLVSQWTVPPNERGDLDAFAYPVRRPKNREEVNEEACPICLGTKPKPNSWIVFGACNHATCNSCFKKIVADQKLLAACPICRTLLAQGEGNRGGPKPKSEIDQSFRAGDSNTTSTTSTTTSDEGDGEAGPLHSGDDNV